MSYRPVTDIWILARAKLTDDKTYYGAYPGGFPERARALLGVSINDPVLHMCSGLVKHYPYKGGFGPNDKTMDLDPATNPDYVWDVRIPLPVLSRGWRAILTDPPYTEQDAEHYVPGAGNFPKPNLLLSNALQAVRAGGRVGMLHYILPSPPRVETVGFETKFIAAVGVLVGFNNRIRVYSVFERLDSSTPAVSSSADPPQASTRLP